MSDNTKIQWTKHTGGPWLGCTEVSCGCGKCYARELLLKRLAPIIRKAYKNAGFADWETRPLWGDKAVRVLTKSFWTDAVAWNRRAQKAGIKESIFPSMIDWLDNMPSGIIDQEGNWLDVNQVLADFLKLIHDTPHLTWLLLTKRPENFKPRVMAAIASITDGSGRNGDFWQWMVNWVGGKPPANVWLGVSCENQEMADKRIPELLKIPAKIRFISAEPLLGPIDFKVLNTGDSDNLNSGSEHPRIRRECHAGSDDTHQTSHREGCSEKREGNSSDSGTACIQKIDWIIFGGESGAGARPCNVVWIRDGLRQCRVAGVKAFVKQLGSNPVRGEGDEPFEHLRGLHKKGGRDGASHTVATAHPKGGDPAEWPEDLHVREFPATD